MINPAPLDPLPRRSAEICRGTLRLMSQLGYYGLTEMTLANHRRADIAAIGPAGDIWMIEIKSSIQDFKSDTKWLSWLAYQFHIAVGAHASSSSHRSQSDDSMDLVTFKRSFFFKVVRLLHSLT